MGANPGLTPTIGPLLPVRTANVELIDGSGMRVRDLKFRNQE
jgi:hypothetical protein